MHALYNIITHLMYKYVKVLTHKCIPIYIYHCYFMLIYSASFFSRFFFYQMRTRSLSRCVDSSDIWTFEKKTGNRRRINRCGFPFFFLLEEKSETSNRMWREKKRQKKKINNIFALHVCLFSLFPVKWYKTWDNTQSGVAEKERWKTTAGSLNHFGRALFFLSSYSFSRCSTTTTTKLIGKGAPEHRLLI